MGTTYSSRYGSSFYPKLKVKTKLRNTSSVQQTVRHFMVQYHGRQREMSVSTKPSGFRFRMHTTKFTTILNRRAPRLRSRGILPNVDNMARATHPVRARVIPSD